MEKTTSALPVQTTRSASLRAMPDTRFAGAAVVVAAHAVGRVSVGVTPSYERTVMPFAGRVRGTDLLIDVAGPTACAPPD